MNNPALYILLLCLALPLLSYLFMVISLVLGRSEDLSELSMIKRIRQQAQTVGRLRDSAANPWKPGQDQFEELSSIVDDLKSKDQSL
jgi:hypothetical protein